jgi:hypothetical protein
MEIGEGELATEPHPIFAHAGATSADKVFKNDNKPDGFADVRVEDYFDLAFEALPHKVSYPGVYDLLLTKNCLFS